MKIKLIVLILLFSPILVKGYDLSDYDPFYTPFNLDSATEYDPCKDEVEEFDTKYWELHHQLIYLPTNPQGLSGGALESAINNVYATFKSNDLKYEIIFKECLAEELKKAGDDQSVSLSGNDSVSLSNPVYNERLRIEEQFKKGNFSALEDFTEKDYEKYKDLIEKYVNVPEPEIKPMIVPTAQPVAQPTQQVVTYTPQMTKPFPEPKTITPESAPSTEATATPKEMVMTEDELDRIVQEKLDVALANQEIESEPEPKKPSFFKRVWGFLFDWF